MSRTPGADPLHTTAPPPGGGRVGPYRLVRELGRGGMGVVYEAVDERLGRRVALKRIDPDLCHGPARDRLRREAALTARLTHPGIVRVHEIREWQDSAGGPPALYLALGLIDGPSLDARGPQRPLAECVGLVEAVARAAGHAHAHGVVHRDIKPANVLLTASGAPVLTDFGLATAHEVTRLTAEGAQVGTPRYMAPEQIRGEHDRIGPHTDVWALGVMLHELISGTPPFDADGFAALQQRILETDPPPLTHRGGPVPRTLEDVCRKALARDPQRRYAEGVALAEDLARWRTGAPVDASRLRARLARQPGRIAAAAAALVLAAAAVTVGIRGLADRRARDAAVAEVDRLAARGQLAEALAHARRQLARAPHPGLATRAARLREQLGAARAARDTRLAAEQSRRATSAQLDALQQRLARIRALLYLPGREALEALRSLEPELTRLGAGPALPDADNEARRWALVGTGWLLVGRLEAAEPALRKAAALRPRDGTLHLRMAWLALHRGLAERLFAHWSDDDEAAERWSREAATWLQRPADRWSGGAAPIDRHQSRLRRRYATGKHDGLGVKISEGLAEFEGQPGTEYYWLIRSLIAGQPSARERALERALERRPHFSWAYLSLAWHHTHRKQPDAAAQACRRALQINPRLGFAWLMLGRILAERRPQEALTAIDEAAALLPHSPHVPSFRAIALAELGRLDEALAVLDRGIEAARPDDASLHHVRAEINRRRGDAAAALADIDEAIRREPGRAAAYNTRGKLLRTAGRLDAAHADHLRATELAPRKPGGWLNLGGVLLALDRPDEAETALLRAAELGPREPLHHWALGSLRLRQARYGEAETHLNRALAIDPAYAFALHDRAVVYRRQGRHPSELRDLSALLAVEPGRIQTRLERVSVLIKLGRPGPAEAELRRVFAAPTPPISAFILRGEVHQMRGRLPAALADLDRAVAMDPAQLQSRVTRARIRLAARRTDAALTDLAVVLARTPAHAEARRLRRAAWVQRAEVHRLAGRLDAALGDIDRAIADGPRDPYGYFARSLVRQQRGQHREAISDLDRAIALDPNRYAYWTTRGDSKCAIGDLAGGVADTGRGAELAPGNWVCRLRHAIALRRAGRLAPARAALAKALTLAPADQRPGLRAAYEQHDR